MILVKFCFGPLGTNAVLLGCEITKRCAVIDPGFRSTEVLLKTAQKDQLAIEKILLTHSHWDHIAGVSSLKMATGAQVCVHPLDRENVQRPGSDGIPFGEPIEGTQVDHLFQDGEIFYVGTLCIHVIHTPGHSPGGVCFYLPEERLLFAGDTLFRGTIGSLSLPTASAEKMWPTLQKLSALPPETRVIPGHGGETTIGREQWIAHAKDRYE